MIKKKMKKSVVKNFIGYGIFVLFIIFGMWFVIAAVTNQAPDFAKAEDPVVMLTFNVSNDTGVSGTTVHYIMVNNTGSAGAGNITNVTITNGTWTKYNDTTDVFPVNVTIDKSVFEVDAGQNFNVTFVLNSTITDDLTIQANVTDIGAEENVTTGFDATFNSSIVKLDGTAPVTTIVTSSGWKLGNLIIESNSTDATSNVTNSSYYWFGNDTGNFSTTALTTCAYVSATVGFNCSATFDTSNLADGNYTLWINASDTPGNIRNTSKLLIGVDNTNPSVSLSKSSSSTSSIVVSTSCTDVTSGVKSGSCVLSSSAGSVSGSTISGLSCGNPYTITLTATDNAGNTVSTSTSMSTEPCGGGSAATPSEWVSQRSHSWARIRVGETATMESFDLDTGVNRIQIQVRNEVQNVKIEVKKYENKPAEVSVEKSGKVHKYLQIETENLANNLERATVRIQVQKSWMESNNLQIENIAMFRFNENNQWVELETDYVESDNDYYYYDVELDSFSYFAIGESLIAETETEDEIKTPLLDTEGKNLTWLWVLIVIVVLSVLWFAFEKKGKKRKN